MRDEPGLGRGGEGMARPRPCRGVSDEAETEQLGSPAVSEATGTWTRPFMPLCPWRRG